MTKAERYDLTHGNILQKLTLLALPLMAGQFVQTAYNLTDMFWLGQLGSGAVAASGTVGIYIWLAQAFFSFGAKGAEIGVSQSLGRRDGAAAKAFGRTSLTIGLLFGLAYAAVMFLFRGPLIGFYAIQEAYVARDAETYLAIISLGIPFTFVTGAAAGIFNGSGNSTTPFVVNALALLLNIVLDPLLIFGLNMGIAGAAWATILAQILGCVLQLLFLARYRHQDLTGIRLRPYLGRRQLKHILRWGVPLFIESFTFTFLYMFISRFVAAFGADAIAAQRLGSQMESLAYLVAGGFASAFAAYVGQNFGAGLYSRIRAGMRSSFFLMAGWGVVVTLFLYFGAQPVFQLFLPQDPQAVSNGVEYLRILAFCQVFSCLESLAFGAFRGIGKTTPPAVISITVNTARMLAAWLLSQTALGLSGIWWALAVGCALRGLLFIIFGALAVHKLPRMDSQTSKPADPVPAEPSADGSVQG